MEHFQDGDRVCGRDEGAEEEALDPGSGDVEEREGRVHNGGDGGSGEEGRDEGEEGDGQFLAGEIEEVEQEGAGEEEQAEHAVEDEVFETDAPDEDYGSEMDGGEEMA